MSDRQPSSVVIPLDVLTSSAHLNCEISSGLHAIVQERFTHVMGHHFKPVPSNRDIWYYHLQRAGEDEEDEEEEEGVEGETEKAEDGEDLDHAADDEDDQVGIMLDQPPQKKKLLA